MRVEKHTPPILIEGYKNLQDYFKHITTLDTGAILLMVAFIEKAFKNPKSVDLAIIAFICFVASLICSVDIMYFYAKVIMREEQNKVWQENKVREIFNEISFFLSRWAFIVGMILLSIFAIVNLSEGIGGSGVII